MLTFLPIISGVFANPIARIVVFVAGAFVFGWYKGWASVPRVDVPAIVRNAESTRDVYWEGKMRETEDQARKAIDAAIEARDTIAGPVDVTVAGLCDADRDCIDARRR